MTGAGLRPVPNPSQLFLAERPKNVPGSSVLCTIEGSRPILVEVQALVERVDVRQRAPHRERPRPEPAGAAARRARQARRPEPRDRRRVVNVAGGMTIDEPAADLAVVAAVASSLRNRPIPPDVVVFGEVGLAGEVRADDAGAAARARGGAARLHALRHARWQPGARRRARPGSRSSACARSARRSTR